MAKTASHIPPSRVRYENSHPTVSCRVSREFYNSLVNAKTRENKSFADILKLGLGKIENADKKLREANDKSFSEGYERGMSDAEDYYKVIYHCRRCGKEMVVINQEEKKAVDSYMSSGWGHTECPRTKSNRIP
jgi:hypothetical protein